jgi:hypothetical protein
MAYMRSITPHHSPVVSFIDLKLVTCMFVIIAVIHYGNTTSALTCMCAHHSIKIHASDKNIRQLLEKKQNSRDPHNKCRYSHTILTPIWLGKTQYTDE